MELEQHGLFFKFEICWEFIFYFQEENKKKDTTESP